MANIPNNNGRVGIMGISYDAEDAALLKRRHTGRVDRADHLFGCGEQPPWDTRTIKVAKRLALLEGLLVEA